MCLARNKALFHLLFLLSLCNCMFFIYHFLLPLLIVSLFLSFSFLPSVLFITLLLLRECMTDRLSARLACL